MKELIGITKNYIRKYTALLVAFSILLQFYSSPVVKAANVTSFSAGVTGDTTDLYLGIKNEVTLEPNISVGEGTTIDELKINWSVTQGVGGDATCVSTDTTTDPLKCVVTAKEFSSESVAITATLCASDTDEPITATDGTECKIEYTVKVHSFTIEGVNVTTGVNQETSEEEVWTAKLDGTTLTSDEVDWSYPTAHGFEVKEGNGGLGFTREPNFQGGPVTLTATLKSDESVKVTKYITVYKAYGSVTNKGEGEGGYALSYPYSGSPIAGPEATNFEYTAGGSLTFEWYLHDDTAENHVGEPLEEYPPVNARKYILKVILASAEGSYDCSGAEEYLTVEITQLSVASIASNNTYPTAFTADGSPVDVPQVSDFTFYKPEDAGTYDNVQASDLEIKWYKKDGETKNILEEVPSEGGDYEVTVTLASTGNYSYTGNPVTLSFSINYAEFEGAAVSYAYTKTDGSSLSGDDSFTENGTFTSLTVNAPTGYQIRRATSGDWGSSISFMISGAYSDAEYQLKADATSNVGSPQKLTAFTIAASKPTLAIDALENASWTETPSTGYKYFFASNENLTAKVNNVDGLTVKYLVDSPATGVFDMTQASDYDDDNGIAIETGSVSQIKVNIADTAGNNVDIVSPQLVVYKKATLAAGLTEPIEYNKNTDKVSKSGLSVQLELGNDVVFADRVTFGDDTLTKGQYSWNNETSTLTLTRDLLTAYDNSVFDVVVYLKALNTDYTSSTDVGEEPSLTFSVQLVDVTTVTFSSLDKTYDGKAVSPVATVETAYDPSPEQAEVHFVYYEGEVTEFTASSDPFGVPAATNGEIPMESVPKDAGTYTVLVYVNSTNHVPATVYAFKTFTITKASWQIAIVKLDAGSTTSGVGQDGYNYTVDSSTLTRTDDDSGVTFKYYVQKTVTVPVDKSDPSQESSTYYIGVRGVNDKDEEKLPNADNLTLTYKLAGNDDSSFAPPASGFENLDPGLYILRATIDGNVNANYYTSFAEDDFSIAGAASGTGASVEIKDTFSKVYDGLPAQPPTYNIIGASEGDNIIATIEYRVKPADPDDITTGWEMVSPVNAGDYQARVTIQTVTLNNGEAEIGVASVIGDFSIYKCYVTVSVH